ncbi:MAG TPA: sugar phosphate isomerase/epimerase family protein [Sedimentisphaerales bacterium]|nr:sugar phosphate isomerase/epimerase family protein [Sedimentisphaerales bacterium]
MGANQLSRRGFLMAAGAGAAFAMATRGAAAEAKKVKLSTPNAEKLGWRLSCGLYTFRDRSFYEAIDVIAGLGIVNIEPAFFLPLSKDQPDLKTNESLSAEPRREMKRRLDDRGLKMASYYAPLEADTNAFRKVFDFAKEMGVETLVAEPAAEVIEKLDSLCQEYRINLAIHNHAEAAGSRYWKPENVLKVSEGRSKAIGACPDTGHYVRTGLDPSECLKKLEGRIISVHLKDVAEVGKVDARDVPLGQGKANYTQVLQTLQALKFKGLATIEYEHLSPQLVEDVAQCVKFVEDFASAKV